jgi:hypothetical protein
MKTLLCAALSGAASFSSGYGDNLLENGSFELPKVTGRTQENKGGNPALVEGKTRWETFTINRSDKGGTLSAGITDEIARTGKQSLYVDFEKLSGPSQQALLETSLIPVKAMQSYRISIWGRIDRKRPLSLDERRPYIWINVQFFQKDQETAAGDLESGAQLIPGNIVPGIVNALVFNSRKWSESFSTVESPENAAFVKVRWTWGTTKDEGETDGVVYWDDAAIEEAPRKAPSKEESDKNAASHSGDNAKPAAGAKESIKP